MGPDRAWLERVRHAEQDAGVYDDPEDVEEDDGEDPDALHDWYE